MMMQFAITFSWNNKMPLWGTSYFCVFHEQTSVPHHLKCSFSAGIVHAVLCKSLEPPRISLYILFPRSQMFSKFSKLPWVIVLQAFWRVFNWTLDAFNSFLILSLTVLIHITLIYDLFQHKKAHNSMEKLVQCLHITDNLAKKQFQLYL